MPSRVNMPGTAAPLAVRLLPTQASGVWVPVIEGVMDKTFESIVPCPSDGLMLETD